MILDFTTLTVLETKKRNQNKLCRYTHMNIINHNNVIKYSSEVAQRLILEERDIMLYIELGKE